MASGRPIKKPVKSNLLKARKDANEKALKSGFMKMPDYAKKKFDESKDKDWPKPLTKDERDEHLKKLKKAVNSKPEPSAYQFKDGKFNPLYRKEEKAPTGKHKMSKNAKKTLAQIAYSSEQRRKAINNSTRQGRLPEEQQLDELSPKTLKNYTTKVLSKTPPHELDDKQIKNIRRAGQKIYDKEYSKTGKPVKNKAGKIVGMVHKEEQQIDEISSELMGRHAKAATKQVHQMQKLKDNPKTPSAVKKAASQTIRKRSKGLDKTWFYGESSSWLDQTADTWNDHADHKHPKVQKHIKKAEKAYNDKDYEGFHHHTNRAADHAHSLKKNEATADEVLKKRYASYHPDDNPQATRKLKPSEHDQPKGARVYKMHPGAKLTDRGYSKKGKMAALKKQHARRPEQYGIKEMMMKDLSEISPAVKSRYIHKANMEISNLEKAKDQAHKDMGKDSAPVEKHMDKKATKRRKGVQQARKDLKRPQQFNSSKGIWEGYFKRQATAAQERQRVAALQSKAKKQSNQQTTTASKDPMKEEQKRVVESLGKLMSRGIDSVKKFQDSDTAKQIRQKKTTAGVKPVISQKKRLAK